MSGVPEWGVAYSYPQRIVTDDGLILMDDLLEDLGIAGVATRSHDNACFGRMSCLTASVSKKKPHLRDAYTMSARYFRRTIMLNKFKVNDILK